MQSCRFSPLIMASVTHATLPLDLLLPPLLVPFEYGAERTLEPGVPLPADMSVRLVAVALGRRGRGCNNDIMSAPMWVTS